MAIVQLPSGVRARSVSWRFQDAKVWQVSEFTGRTRVANFGPAGRWLAEVEFPPLTAAQLRAFRGMQADLLDPLNGLLLFAATNQHAGPNMTLGSALSAGATTCTLTHPFLSTQLLNRGDMIAFLVGGPIQMVTLTAPVTTNGAGSATATWAQPLRAGVAPGLIETRSPYSLMRTRQPLEWRTDPGPFSTVRLELEESFEALN